MTPVMLLATTNPGKVVDWEPLLARSGWQCRPMTSEQVQETGKTPLENARLKAAHAAGLHPTVLADDVALHVEAMGGEPGLRLKAWAMSLGGWPAARHALSALDGSPATFVIGVAVYVSGRLYAQQETRLSGVLRACTDGDEGPGVEPCFVAQGSDVPLSRLTEHLRDRYHYRHLAWSSIQSELRQLSTGVSK